MIEKITKYKVAGLEFDTLKQAQDHAEDNLAEMLRPSIYGYTGSGCGSYSIKTFKSVMISMIENKDIYINLLQDLEYLDEDEDEDD